MKKNVKILFFVFVLVIGVCCLVACSSADAGTEESETSTGNDSALESGASVSGASESKSLSEGEFPENTSIVRISVNPQIEVYLDPDKRVLASKALNDDAQKVLGSMDKNKAEEFDWFFIHMLDACVDLGYLTEGNTVDVAVVKTGEPSDLSAEKIAETTELRFSEVMEARHLECGVRIVDASQGDGSSGICMQCKGKKEIPCDLCNGGRDKVKCHFCQSSGLEECGKCNGKKAYPCHWCDQTGRRPEETIVSTCGMCKGTGKLWCTPGADWEGWADNPDPQEVGWWGECEVCHSTGHSKHHDPERKCENCHGTGAVACDQCGQTGRSACHNCNGAGTMEHCERCGGNGNMKCPMCQE